VTFDELPDVLTVEEFAAFARIGRRQAYAAVRRGEIYSARINRSLRIPKAAVRRWLEGGVDGEVHRPHLAVVGGTDGTRRDPGRA